MVNLPQFINGSGPLGTAVVFLWALQIIINVAFALAVWTRARRQATIFVAPRVWALATLLGGPLTALAYWLINESSLAGGIES